MLQTFLMKYTEQQLCNCKTPSFISTSYEFNANTTDILTSILFASTWNLWTKHYKMDNPSAFWILLVNQKFWGSKAVLGRGPSQDRIFSQQDFFKTASNQITKNKCNEASDTSPGRPFHSQHVVVFPQVDF